MIHTDASTIPVGSIVYVTWEDEPGAPEGSVKFFGNGYGAYGVVVEPPKGALWAVDVDGDKPVTNLTNESEVKYVVGSRDELPESTDSSEFVLGEVMDTTGDRLDVLLYTDDDEVLILRSVDQSGNEAEIWLSRDGVDELIGTLITARDRLNDPDSPDESTAGDPPRPEGLSLAVGGCCGGSCSR